MRLIIKEYLSQLKESKELDRLLPDLLLSMNFIPTSIPQVGVRQYGVDIASEYIDENNNKILYIFVIKQGDIGRKDWDSTPQSIRQSLNEIKDVYIEKIISSDQKMLLKKIIVCTSGVLLQEAKQNWNGYIEQNTIKDKVEYDLWDGFKLALDIEKYMLNEFILLDNFKSKLRKILALLGDPDYDLSDYYSLLKDNLLVMEKDKNKTKRLLFSIRLVLNIIWSWSKENDNIKPALYAAERTILNTWDFYKRNLFFDDIGLVKIFGLFFQDFVRIYTNYFIKIHKLCNLHNGFNDYSRYCLLENLNIYEQLGIIAITGLNNFYYVAIYDDKNIINIAENVKNSLMAFIDNHSSVSSPVYDDHIIEIVLALILLSNFNEIHYIENWIDEIINRIEFAYRVLKKYFPVDTDSLEDAILFLSPNTKKKENMMKTSTLLIILLQFSAVLRLDSLYKKIVEIISRSFKDTTLQIWFPDDTTDDFMYIENAGYSSGLAFIINTMPDNSEDMNKLLLESNKKYIVKDSISAIKQGFMVLPLIASRHFRMPVLPLYWSMYIDVTKNDDLDKV